MPRALRVAMLVAAAAAESALAQLPRAVSPRLAAALDRADTTALVWIIARASTDLNRLAAAVTARGGQVRRVSQFVHAVSASVPGAAIRDLARETGVVRVQPVGVYFRARRRPGAPAPGQDQAAPWRLAPPAPSLLAADTLYGTDAWVAQQLDVAPLHARGLRGSGVRLAMLDAGFNTAHPYMAGARITAQRDFVYNDTIVRDQPGEAQGEMAHGTATWSLIAANAPGQLFGMAPDAEFLLAKTEFTPTETRTEEDNWVAAVEWAAGLGANILSSSLGYLSFDNGFTYTTAQLNGDFAVTTIAADSAAKRGILVVVSVGNDGPGPRTLATPADADSVVAVGATDSLARVVSFSSRGPTADGRIKPEVVAPGSAVTVASIDSGLVRASGTSFSAPLVAGIAALVEGSRIGRPAFELRRGLLQASSRAGAPDNTFGYGIPDAVRLLAFPTGLVALAPASGTLGTLTPTFSWDAESPPADVGPNVYRLRIGTDTTLQTAVLDTVVGTTTFTLPFPLPSGLRAWWRVIASSSLGVAESTAARGPVITPPWVHLVTLATSAGASIRDSLPLFVWRSPAVSAPPGPFFYDVDVYPASRSPAEAVASARGITDTTFRPAQPLERNLPFRWRVVAHLGPDSVIFTSPGTFLVLDESMPVATVLFQNFPNPFPSRVSGVATTCIWFDVATGGDVRLEIFDIRGRLVRLLAPAGAVPAQLVAGRYGRPSADAPGTCDERFAWDGRDDRGEYVRPGVYVYRLTAPGFRDSRRMVFLGPR